MKTGLKLSVFALAVLMGINANAQSATSSTYGYNGGDGGFSFGVKAGVNFAGFTGKGAENLDGKVGANVGVFAEYALPSNVYFLSGLDFTMKGAKKEVKESGYKYKVTLSPVYLQLPIHAGYKIEISDGMSLGLHAGPYLAYGIGGKIKAEGTGEETEKSDFFGSEEKGGYKSFDFGLGLGADFNINKFRVGLGYDFGLTNIDRDKDYPVRNRNFFVNVGYRF